MQYVFYIYIFNVTNLYVILFKGIESKQIKKSPLRECTKFLVSIRIFKLVCYVQTIN